MSNKKIIKTIFISLLAASILIALASENPMYSIKLFFITPFSKFRYFANIVENMIPLIFTGLGMCFIFASGYFNLAIEGGFHAGGFTAACFVILSSNAFIHNTFTVILISGLVGSIILLIPALIKMKSGGSELVASLMLNFIVLHISNYILIKCIRDPMTGYGSYRLNLELATLIPSTRIHIGLLIAIIMVIFAYFFLYKSKFGLKIRIVGQNREYAENIGINIAKVLMLSQVLGGFLAGMGGAIELLSPIYIRYSWINLLGFGWDAVIIAILSKNNPLKVPIYAFFLAYIRTGSYIMERLSDVSSDIVLIFQAIIILLFISDIFIGKKKGEKIC